MVNYWVPVLEFRTPGTLLTKQF